MKVIRKMPPKDVDLLIKTYVNGEKSVEIARMCEYMSGKHSGQMVWVLHNTSRELPVRADDLWQYLPTMEE